MKSGFTCCRPVALVFLILNIFVGVCFAQFAGGNGTPENPYQVADAGQLNSIRNHLDAHFVLIADLDLDSPPYNTDSGWIPLGTVDAPFTGSFDGDKHSISNLFISRPGADYQGLFGYSTGAELSRIKLQNAQILGNDYTASLPGRGLSTTISGVSVTGNVQGSSIVGGIVASLELSGTITQSLANCSVNGYWSIGGIVGYSKGNSTIDACVNKGAISGTNAVGGIAGTQNNSSLNFSYNLGAINGSWGVGGLLGVNDARSTVTYCYSTGYVNGSYNVGGLVGRSILSQTENSYWNIENSGRTNSAGGIGRLTYEMVYPYSGATFTNWDFTNLWFNDSANEVNGGYPYLQWQEQLLPPTDLVAYPGIEQVFLQWQAPIGSYPLGYKVYRDGILLTQQPIIDSEYYDYGLTGGTSYQYYVTSVYRAGESVASNVVEATPQASVTIPGAAALISPQDGAQNIDPNALLFQWEAPVSGSPAEAYVIYFSNSLQDLYSGYNAEVAYPDTSYSPDPEYNFGYGEQWYWQVVPYNTAGSALLDSCPIFSFYTFFPEISITPNQFYYNITTSDTLNLQVVISNTGSAELVWDRVLVDNRNINISFYPASGVIAPGSSQICTLNVTPIANQTGTYSYELIINSNDLANPVITIPIEIEVRSPLAYIPDDNLRYAINAYLEQELEYQPTIEDLNEMTGWLDAAGRNISNLVGSQHLINLQGVNLIYNMISDLSPLANLTNLQNLNLQNNQISDLSPLANLTNMQELNLQSNQISDLSYLANLINLQELGLQGNQVSDLSYLANMANLLHLFLSGNQISDLSPLANLTNLQELYLGGNQISDLAPLVNLINLQGLFLDNNQINDISHLANLMNLQALGLGGNQIVDLSIMANLTYLQGLWLSGNQINDLTPLANLTYLQGLYLSRNQISDLTPLAGLTTLQELYLSNNPLSKESMLLTQSWSLPYVAETFNPLSPGYPDPERNGLDIPVNTGLIWEANYDAQPASYEVYLGTSASELTYQGLGSAGSNFQYSYLPSLQPNTEYWWRIKAITGTEEIWSGLWHYQTTSQLYAPPRNISIVSMTPNVVLTWQAPLFGTPLSYQIWRLLPGQETEESSWTLVSGMVADTTVTDVQWQYLADGTYKWAVKAMYEGAIYSAAAFSNELIKQNAFPDIAVTPSVINHTMEENSYNQVMIDISNNGAANLDWSSNLEQVRNSASSPLLSTKTGSNHPTRDLSLDFSPASGITPPLYSSTCYLNISTTGADPGVYNYTLTINSNDPDTPSLEIPIELTVQQVVNIAPVVSNVQAMQRDDASMMMDIYYDVYDANSDTLNISMQVSDDDGLTWNVSCNLIETGSDIGSGILSGTNKHIVWDVANEHPNVLGSNYRFKITADDGASDMPANFVFVEGGTFNNGTSDVTLSSFYIDKYELTQADYQAVMGTNPATGYGVGSNYPIYYVSWFNAIEYCNRRSLQEGLTPCYSYSTFGTNPDSWSTGWNTSDANHTNVNCNWTANGYRLPTEMEWMFAARGGNLTHNYTYSGSNDLNAVGRYWDNWGSANNSTNTVGGLAANELGIFDMSGNVWEWTWDIYGSYPSGSQNNPTGASSGSYRVGRGGSWFNFATDCTVSGRSSDYATSTYYDIGFRCVRVSP
ncbi:MAG: SUMF1/EgtB/PvdO family nonheme iron enzyme [Candidatus Cloacimonetes bacterium]|nr:SUMF1/EgtB/PvdO family nonheme iron enzyme [Candidatus Cloacimonadota bacterium]